MSERKPSEFSKAEAIFFEVVGLSPADRGAVIERLCEGDESLKGRVMSLLASADGVGAFLEQPALGRAFDQLSAESEKATEQDELVGTQLGVFRLERRLASGGMGTVYLGARADAQFEQRVAIKVIKRGMDTEEIVRRFREERQTLAQLNHPHIARLYDGGVTPDGRPYLVMEHVEGLPIDRYCNERKLSISDRLRLFQQVCEGVHAAHQALVIHRDLKPSNILVTSAGIPKLLDFGIAKVVSGTGVVTQTMETDRRLTPEYASPEQVDGSHLTTASDVYALGVILYELLSGVRPYNFVVRSKAEIHRAVCEELPPMPSEVIATRGTRGRTGTALRSRTAAVSTTVGTMEGSRGVPGEMDHPRTHGMTSARLRGQLRGDLDTIVMMALRKEPTRRYASAEQFSADIGRFLSGMPVQARRDTWVYRTRKFVRRNAVAVGFGALAVAALAGGLALQTHHKRQIEQQRNELRSANTRLEESRGVLVNMLSGAQTSGKGPSATLGEVLLDSAKMLETSPPKDVMTLAGLQEAVGTAMMTLGMTEKARPLLQAARDAYIKADPEGEAAHGAAIELAQLLYYEQKFAEAEGPLRELLKAERSRNGAVGTAHEGDLLNALGAVLRLQGKLDEALTTQQESLAVRKTVFGDGSLQVAESHNNIATIHLGAGRYAEAIVAYRRSMEIRTGKLRAGHPLLLATSLNLGLTLVRAGETAEAIPLLRSAVDGWELAYGADHPGIVNARTALGQALRSAGRFDESLVVLRAALAWQSTRVDVLGPAVVGTKANIALSIAGKGPCTDAVAELERVRLEPSYGKLSAGLMKLVDEALIRAYEECGRKDDAQRLRESRKAVPKP